MGRDRHEALVGFGHEDPDPRAPIVQPPRAHQRAAVAACAGQYGDPLAARVSSQKVYPAQVGEGAPGVLHHLDQLYAEVLDHGPVHLDHLLGGQVGDLAPVGRERHGVFFTSAFARRAPPLVGGIGHS
ncbi:MAG: hypothetical protein M3Q60_19480 [Actinomycetota bacterium]|nr:hypothetical protein [Actinomycetota bacterium]